MSYKDKLRDGMADVFAGCGTVTYEGQPVRRGNADDMATLIAGAWKKIDAEVREAVIARNLDMLRQVKRDQEYCTQTQGDVPGCHAQVELFEDGVMHVHWPPE